jgi:uncharacterized membrane protein YeaQ/YmgE (transglycosylase-associated protein family)
MDENHEADAFSYYKKRLCSHRLERLDPRIAGTSTMTFFLASLVIGSIIITLFIGGMAGWLAGKIIKGDRRGLVGNVVVGVSGSAIAGLILPKISPFIGGGLIGGLVGAIINAAIGGVIVLLILSFIRKNA